MNSEISSRPAGRATPEAGSRDQELLQELRAAWGIAANAPLTVIGQLRVHHRADGQQPLFFLEGLEHPESGVGLVYPQPAPSGPARAFVLRSEANQFRASSGALWAIAELELSPFDERQKHKNPYECSVRRGTLRPLRDVPEQWTVSVNGPASARRITAAAREVIEANIREELARLDEDIAHAKKRKSGAELELERTRNTIRSEQLRLEELGARIFRESELMEDRFRRLAELLAEKGRRLVALDLVDEDDLDALLPHRDAPDERPGHDFRDSLGGDFARVAPFVQARLWKRRMLFSKALLRDFLALIRTHDLIVLAGDSGSGKTSLIRAVADSIGGRCTVIPVKPNWTGPEDLLGYYNPIERSYQPTPFLLALQAAQKEPEVPHFICLDEMNLARIEHYFADFLSVLEVRNESPDIQLYTSAEERHTVVESGLFLSIEAEARARSGLPENATLEDMLKNEQTNRLLHQLGGFQDAESVLLHHARLRRSLAAHVHTPTSLRFPPNVRIIGAINVDETTHYLSPKVLDRVHVLRFRNPVLTDWDELEAEVEKFDLDLDLPLRLSSRDLGPREDYPPFNRLDPDAAFLADLARRQLDPLGIEFGFRAIRQAANYIRQAEAAGIDTQAALNNVILHKVLPKLMLDTGRTSSDGRGRRDILIALRDELRDRMAALDPSAVTESCVEALDQLIAAAEGNNGIANYWLR